MNDNDIIKALEHCVYKDHKDAKCTTCEHVTGCKTLLLREALNLINRQKAQIDSLCSALNVSSQNLENMARAMPNIARAERIVAIKEFAERLKGNCISVDTGDRSYKIITTIWIDNLVAEMTEGGT